MENKNISEKDGKESIKLVGCSEDHVELALDIYTHLELELSNQKYYNPNMGASSNRHLNFYRLAFHRKVSGGPVHHPEILDFEMSTYNESDPKKLDFRIVDSLDKVEEEILDSNVDYLICDQNEIAKQGRHSILKSCSDKGIKIMDANEITNKRDGVCNMINTIEKDLESVSM
jgi:hypothetical protein